MFAKLFSGPDPSAKQTALTSFARQLLCAKGLQLKPTADALMATMFSTFVLHFLSSHAHGF